MLCFTLDRKVDCITLTRSFALTGQPRFDRYLTRNGISLVCFLMMDDDCLSLFFLSSPFFLGWWMGCEGYQRLLFRYHTLYTPIYIYFLEYRPTGDSFLDSNRYLIIYLLFMWRGRVRSLYGNSFRGLG